MLAIDTSDSMRHAIADAKEAASALVTSMPASMRIGVETFGDDVTVLTPPTTDRALLAAQIDSIVTVGNTALYDAVVAGSAQFSPAATQRVLVLVSDGRDDGSAATLEQAVAAVAGEHVEAISLTTPQTDLASLSALGAVTPADDAAGVSAAFWRGAGGPPPGRRGGGGRRAGRARRPHLEGGGDAPDSAGPPRHSCAGDDRRDG